MRIEVISAFKSEPDKDLLKIYIHVYIIEANGDREKKYIKKITISTSVSGYGGGQGCIYTPV